MSIMRPHKIILVEDNKADAELTKMALKEIPMAFEIVHFDNGKGLIEYLTEEASSDVAVVLLDLNMPSLNGKELLKRICDDEELNKIPVVIFTTSSNQPDIQECYAIGANAYVKKPIDVNEFQKAIKAIALFWLDVNVLPSAI